MGREGVLAAIGRYVDGASKALDDDDPDRRTHRHTLLFAIDQVERGLGDLVDSFAELDTSS